MSIIKIAVGVWLGLNLFTFIDAVATMAHAGQAKTRVHTVTHNTPVEHVTHERTVIRVHPVHEITDVTRVLHHNVWEHKTEQEGPAPGHDTEHTVTHYVDRYPVDHQTRVHEVDGSPIVNHDITRIVNHNIVHSSVDHETVREEEQARTIVRHKREDTDP